MNKWIDVGIGDWFYNTVIEATNLQLKDGSRWIAGMSYNVYEDGKPYIYHEAVAGASQIQYDLPVAITPTEDNPLSVFVDGVQVLYKEVNGTTVTLYVAPKEGSIVSFISWGKPVVDDYGRPTSNTSSPVYPKGPLTHPYQYVPYFQKTQEFCVVFGRKLRRLDFPYNPNQDIDAQLFKYMGYSNDYYWVMPGGMLFLPMAYNGASATLTYWGGGGKQTETIKVQSPSVLFNNRFFPQAKMRRCEFFTLLNFLRRYMYDKFTDLTAPKGVNQTFTTYLGQNVFRLDGHFNESGLSVSVNGVTKTTGFTVDDQTNYVVFDEHFPEDVQVAFTYNKVYSRFSDVNGSEWWAVHVLEMEDDIVDGEYIINTVNGGFAGEAYMFRQDAVAAMNRFRKWCIERFV